MAVEHPELSGWNPKDKWVSPNPFGFDTSTGSPSLVLIKGTSATHNSQSANFYCFPHEVPTDPTAGKLLCRMKQNTMYRRNKHGFIALRWLSTNAEVRCNGGGWYKPKDSYPKLSKTIGSKIISTSNNGKSPMWYHSNTGKTGSSYANYFFVPCRFGHGW